MEITSEITAKIAPTALSAGQVAPDFECLSDDGQLLRLSQLRGQKVLLYFYPQADTPSCTTQACGLRDAQNEYETAGIVVLGISPDAPKKLKHFREKYHLPFTLLSDMDTHIAQLYGVWGYKKFMGRDTIGIHRTSFLIDEGGIIRHVLCNVRTKPHATQALALFAGKDGEKA